MEQNTPKYTVEQLLEAIQASHLNLVVKGVDGNTVKVIEEGSGRWQVSLGLDSTGGVYSVYGMSQYEASIISSLNTALHILFDSNEEVIY